VAKVGRPPSNFAWVDVVPHVKMHQTRQLPLEKLACSSRGTFSTASAKTGSPPSNRLRQNDLLIVSSPAVSVIARGTLSIQIRTGIRRASRTQG